MRGNPLKKLIMAFIVSATLLAGCGGSNSKTTESNITVEKDKKEVHITFPKEFFDGQSEEEIKEAAKNDGITDVTVNADGTVKYTMSANDHEELVADMEKSLKESIEDLLTDETYPSLENITYNDNFSKYEVTVNRELYEDSYDMFAIMGIGYGSELYNALDGEDDGDNKIEFTLIDVTTKEPFEKITYPDDVSGE
jgi:hypothetical protein